MAVQKLGPIFVGAGSQFTQFWHGWGDNDAVSFSVVVSGDRHRAFSTRLAA